MPEVAPTPPSAPAETPAEPATSSVTAAPEPVPLAPSMESIPPSTPLSGRKKESGVRVIEAGAIREAKRETGRPPLVREEIARAKKSALMDLANAHGLESMGTKVAMIRLGGEGPAILLTDHLAGDRPILVYRVESLADAVAALEAHTSRWMTSGWTTARSGSDDRFTANRGATSGGSLRARAL